MLTGLPGQETTDGQPLEQMETEEPPWMKEQIRRQRRRRKQRICCCVSLIVGLLLAAGLTIALVFILKDLDKKTSGKTADSGYRLVKLTQSMNKWLLMPISLLDMIPQFYSRV